MTALPTAAAESLEKALDAIAQAPILLVASDFDGVLADIVDQPAAARADPQVIDLLRQLASIPHTSIAVISGRARQDLAAKISPGLPAFLVGSHGLEMPPELQSTFNQDPDVVRQITEATKSIASTHAGVTVEIKPASITLHFRGCDDATAVSCVNAANEIAQRIPDVRLLSGLASVELCAFEPDKGKALDRIRYRTGATSTVFVGDDTTDEKGFLRLQQGDVGIKVGPGDTAAGHRLEARTQLQACLERLVSVRSEWAAKRRIYAPERHALLSDQRTIALIDPRGSVVWLCLPRIDSPPIFASLVGGPGSGTFDVEPAGGESDPRLEYAADTMHVRTTWSSMVVTDYFDCSQGRPYQRAGRSDLVRVIDGIGTVRLRFAPRIDFGRLATSLIQRSDGLEIEGAPDLMVLRSPGVAWTIVKDGRHHTAVAEVSLGEQPLVLELRCGTGVLHPSPIHEPQRREQSARFWSGWAASLQVPVQSAGLIRRSALTLKALCQGPSGAIAAAATTSLPEQLGGRRNWDYRFCWPRDAAMAALALVRLGNTGVAMKFLDWIASVVERCESPERLRPIYTVAGSELGSEGEVSDVCGYGDSRPVRIGNAAAHQVQLDVFGPIVDLVAALAVRGVPITPEHWRLVQAMVAAVAARWQEPDHGIWEIRTSKRHHVYSKTMCWLAVDRALTVADLGMGRAVPAWQSLRSQIGEDVLSRGWNHASGAFTTAYDHGEHDAASLWVGLSGLLPPGDPRFRQTVQSVERNLLRGGFVDRYRFDDGLPGTEGAWFLCTSWLIESLVLLGDRPRATELLQGMIARAEPLGLLPEQFEPAINQGLGNYPQAYSHLAMINAMLAVEKT